MPPQPQSVIAPTLAKLSLTQWWTSDDAGKEEVDSWLTCQPFMVVVV